MLLACAREVWKITAQHTIEVQVSHIAGRDNTLADALSRCHLSKAAAHDIGIRAAREGATLLSVSNEDFKIGNM